MSGPGQAGDLQISWISRCEDLSALHAPWQELAVRTAADVYLWPDWVELWWTHFGHGRRLMCMVAHQGGRLVGVLPFALERVWVGAIPLTVARIAGTDPHCLLLRLPLEAAFSATMLEACCNHLLDDCGCHAVSLTPVSERSELASLARGLGQRATRFDLTDQPYGDHVVFDLPDSFETYLAGLSKKRRSQFRRDLNNLEAEYQLKADACAPTAADFSAFMGFHAEQWQAVGRGGHFTDWPGSSQFYTALIDRLQRGSARQKPLQLHCLTGNIGPLATQFLLVSGKIAHWRLPARTLDAGAERLSVGKAGLLLMLGHLIRMGVTCVEAGRGEYDYKIAYGGQSVPVRQILLSPATWGGKMRLRLLLGWAELVNLLYYRIWFWKVAPGLRKVLRRKPGPLWTTWIRTRL